MRSFFSSVIGSQLWKRFSTGIFWSLLGSVLLQGSGLIIGVFVARMLGKSTFGEYTIIQNTVGMLAGFSGMGLGIAATKFVAEFRDKDPAKTGRIIALCSLVTLITGVFITLFVLLFAPVLADSLGASYLTKQFRIASLQVLFVTMNTYQIGVFIGLEAFSKQVALYAFQGLSSLLTMLLLTQWFGLNGAVVGLAVNSFLIWLCYALLLKKEYFRLGFRLSYWKIKREEWKILFTFSLPAASSSIFGGFIIWFCNAMLIKKSEGFSAMASFSAANTFKTLVLFTPLLISRVAGPILNNYRGLGDERNYRRSFLFNLFATTGAGLIVAALLSIFAPTLLRLYGKDFVDGSKVIVALAVAAVLEVIGGAYYQTIYVHGKLWYQFYINAMWCATLVVASALLIPRMGALGLAIAYVAAWALSCFAYIFVSFFIENGRKYDVGPTSLRKAIL